MDHHDDARVIETPTSVPSYNEQWENRIRGCLYGGAIGDAIGYQTEFSPRDKAEEHVAAALIRAGNGVLPYHAGIDPSGLVLPPGLWTDDTDQSLLLLDVMLSHKLQVPLKEFGSRLVQWERNWRDGSAATPPWGEKKGGYGAGNMTSLSCGNELMRSESADLVGLASWGQPFFDPFQKGASNGSLMRTSIMGTRPGTLANIVEEAVRVGRVTHADPRCDAAIAAVVTVVHALVHGKESEPTCLRQLAVGAATEQLRQSCDSLNKRMKESMAAGHGMGPNFAHCWGGSDCAQTWENVQADVLRECGNEEELRRFMSVATIEELALGELPIGFVSKTLGCAMWALSQPDFAAAAAAITRQGGDADTNAVVAMALVGARLGFQAIPSYYVERMVNREWFAGRVDAYIALLRASC